VPYVLVCLGCQASAVVRRNLVLTKSLHTTALALQPGNQYIWPPSPPSCFANFAADQHNFAALATQVGGVEPKGRRALGHTRPL
jgi:hypothetical protein